MTTECPHAASNRPAAAPAGPPPMTTASTDADTDKTSTVYPRSMDRAIPGVMMAAMKHLTIVALTITVGTLAAGLYAQQPAFKRTVLQQADISAPGREVITAMVEF